MVNGVGRKKFTGKVTGKMATSTKRLPQGRAFGVTGKAHARNTRQRGRLR